jgi:hypothetical protein
MEAGNSSTLLKQKQINNETVMMFDPLIQADRLVESCVNQRSPKERRCRFAPNRLQCISPG